MTSGGQVPRVRGSVEKANSQFENTTVGNIETLEETSGAGSSYKNNRISYPGRSQDKYDSANKKKSNESEGNTNPGANYNMEDSMYILYAVLKRGLMKLR